jgi:hypothetical protein
MEQPHKDVAVVIVEVASRLDPEGYQRIAEDELRHVIASRHGQEVPLYEVRFEFLAPSTQPGRLEKSATFVWRSEGVATGTLSLHEERSLVLY